MRRPLLKMSLVGALLSLGVFAADDSRTKDMNKGKADASFVEEAAYISMAEIRMSQLAVSQSTNASVKELAQQMIDDHTKNFEALKEVADKKGIMLPFESSVGSTGTGTTGGTGSTLPGTTEPSTGSTTGTTGSTTGSTGMGTDTTGSTGMGSDTTGTGTGTGSTGTGSGSVGSDTVAETPPTTGTDPSAGTIAKDPAKDGKDTLGTAGAAAAKYSGLLPKAMQKKYDDLSKLSGDRFDRAYLSNLIVDHKKAIKIFEKESRNGEDSELKTWATSTLPTLRSHLDAVQSVEKEVKGRRTGSM